MKGGRFFEFECGGANLGIAVASLLAFMSLIIRTTKINLKAE